MLDWATAITVATASAICVAAMWRMDRAQLKRIHHLEIEMERIRSEQRSLKETFEQQNQLNNGTLLHLNELHDQRISALEQHYYHAKGNNGG